MKVWILTLKVYAHISDDSNPLLFSNIQRVFPSQVAGRFYLAKQFAEWKESTADNVKKVEMSGEDTLIVQRADESRFYALSGHSVY